MHDLDIAVIIPCYNEEETVERVVRSFAETFPRARIYVYDTNSRDQTAARAAAAGATRRARRTSSPRSSTAATTWSRASAKPAKGSTGTATRGATGS